MAKRHRPPAPARQQNRIERLLDAPLFETTPRSTVRDAICDLPDPEGKRQRTVVANHVFNPGVRSYAGHTGSPLDLPAKTMKAGDHGVPGGENMLTRPDGLVRYFTVREAARLQTFPNEFIFQDSWSETMRQLGNAVPVKLGETVAASVAQVLRELR